MNLRSFVCQHFIQVDTSIVHRFQSMVSTHNGINIRLLYISTYVLTKDVTRCKHRLGKHFKLFMSKKGHLKSEIIQPL